MSAVGGGRWMYVPDAVIRHEVPAVRVHLRLLPAPLLRRGARQGADGRACTTGSARSAPSATYLRALPRAVARHLVAASRGRRPRSALRAGSVLAGVAAAGIGGAVETISGRRAPDLAAAR